MNSNWPRWIIASLIKHFDANKGSISVMLVEGVRQHKVVDTSFIELRIDGPSISEASNGYYKVRMEVNVLVNANIDPKDMYALDRLIGIVVVAFKDFAINKLGTGPSDTGETVACMRLVDIPGGASNEKVRVMRFGQVDKNVNVQCASVEGHYVAEIQE